MSELPFEENSWSKCTVTQFNLARNILGISKTQFKDAIEDTRDAAKSNDDQSHSGKLEAVALAIAEHFNAYYDEQKKEYAMEVATDLYQSRTETQFKRDLRFRELTGEMIPARNWSQLDIALRYFQEQKYVNFVGALAGKTCGFYHENGVRILVTSQARVIEPKMGDWGILGELFVILLDTKTKRTQTRRSTAFTDG